jgi:two-component system, LytTR family, response regulator
MTRILVIEDDEQVRLPLVDLLEINGFEVEAVPDGRAGIERARKTSPDLIICDIMMPEVDGYAVLEALQAEPKTAVIPFLFLTAKTTPADIRQGLGMGADDYLAKPYQATELLAAIRMRLEKHARISQAATTISPENDLEHIFIKDGDCCWLVEYAQLRLLESEDNFVRFYFEDEKPLIHRTLNYMEERLPARHFFRANRQQIINLKWIRNIQPWFSGGLLVTLKDGQKVQMSRRAAQVFKARMGI